MSDLRYKKTTSKGSVDSHFKEDDPRVVIKPAEMPAPIYPENPDFWGEFVVVVRDVARAREKAVSHSGVAKCIIEAGFDTADKQALLVEADPTTQVMGYALRAVSDAPYRKFTGLSKSQFTDKAVLMEALFGLVPHWVAPASFCIKDHFKMPRPEEVAGAVAKDVIDAPDRVKMLMFSIFDKTEIATNPRMFTMYQSGSPNHASYWAMHSAAFGAQGFLIKVMRNLSPAQTAEVDTGTVNGGFFRTTAGVHYPQDNWAGFHGGQLVAARMLPGFLRELGAKKAEVDRAIEDAWVDWIEDGPKP